MFVANWNIKCHTFNSRYKSEKIRRTNKYKFIFALFTNYILALYVATCACRWIAMKIRYLHKSLEPKDPVKFEADKKIKLCELFVNNKRGNHYVPNFGIHKLSESSTINSVGLKISNIYNSSVNRLQETLMEYSRGPETESRWLKECVKIQSGARMCKRTERIKPIKGYKVTARERPALRKHIFLAVKVGHSVLEFQILGSFYSWDCIVNGDERDGHLNSNDPIEVDQEPHQSCVA